jgi:DNA-binding response OmpR family regulator
LIGRGEIVPQNGSYTVLIVDDDPDLLDMLARSLRIAGPFTIITATNGIAGLEQALSAAPDCLVIDIVMPGLDGYQLVRALRGDAATARLPLILLTALAQDKSRFVGLASGADQYLTKPVMPQQLAAAIKRAVILNDAERSAQAWKLIEES